MATALKQLRNLDDNELRILALEVGHRSQIYD